MTRLSRSPLARQLAILAVGTALLAFLPSVLPEERHAVAVRTLLLAVTAVGWNIMSGYGGMFSFGHAAYFGIGAYTDAYLLVSHGVSPWIAMLAGGALAAAFGVGSAYLLLRYRLAGAYFALATFAFAQMLLLLVSNLDFLNRTLGFHIPILRDPSWEMLQFQLHSSNYLWIPLGLLATALTVNIALVHSRTGQYIIATRDDETAAEAVGVPVMRYRLVAVAISAAVTAMAGVFYAQYYLYVEPEAAFGSSISVNAIVPAVIGGIGTVWGPVVGAAVVGPLSEVTATILRNPPGWLAFLEGKSGLDVATYGILLILVVLFLSRGIYGTLVERLRR